VKGSGFNPIACRRSNQFDRKRNSKKANAEGEDEKSLISSLTYAILGTTVLRHGGEPHV
jgi:hypothetical protein